MGFPFLEYPAANSIVRANKALLLQPDQWQKLVTANELSDLYSILANTSYADIIDFKSFTSTNQPYLRDVEHALHAVSFRLMKKVLRFAKGDLATLIKAILQRYDLLNLKKSVRKLSNDNFNRHDLGLDKYDLGTNGLFKKGQLEKAETLNELAALLENTYYGDVFRIGLSAFQNNNNLLIFESMLEKAYHQNLIEKVNKMPFWSLSSIQKLVGSTLDEITLEMIVRMRYQYQMAPEAIFNLLPLKGCLLISEKIFWNIAKGADEAECMHLLAEYIDWKKLCGKSLRATIINIKKYRLKLCRRIFLSKSSLSLEPSLAIYFLKEQEILEIIMLLQLKRFNLSLPADTFVLAS